MAMVTLNDKHKESEFKMVFSAIFRNKIRVIGKKQNFVTIKVCFFFEFWIFLWPL